MMLEGVVTNVAAFGAFVDIGVHQDGLVHISALSNTFVKDPRDVAKPGDVVRVKVLEVDQPRKRIAFTMRLRTRRSPASPGIARSRRAAPCGPPLHRRGAAIPGSGAMADALQKAMRARTP